MIRTSGNLFATPFALVAVAGALTLSASASLAEDALPFVSPMFTNNMVLQRNNSDAVWGWTTPGAQVHVSIADRRGDATAGTDGKWIAHVGPLKAGGPYTLSVTGPKSVEFKNVLVGDVWICSGQSNMEFGIGNAINAKDEIASADRPNIRLFTVQKLIAKSPVDTVVGQWDVCTPTTVANGGWNGFSAVGYFFGRNLEDKLKVPIGLIHTSWGGTIAQAWTSESALKAMPDFAGDLKQLDAWRAGQLPAAESDELTKRGPNITTVLYNGMIAPVIPFGIRGAIWYQGESNAGGAYQYRTLLPTMIGDWRTRWDEGKFPFYIVQLANWQAPATEPKDDAWAELREAQTMTANTVGHSGIAVAIDIGDAADIHPKNKQEVGRRLALVALHDAYGKRGEYSGPVYDSMEQSGNQIRIHLSHTTGGLKTSDGKAPTGFAIAGSDHKFVWADARIDGSTIVVSSDKVADPVAVRYAWAINPVCNLVNGFGLPAGPFRTDNWKGITQH